MNDTQTLTLQPILTEEHQPHTQPTNTFLELLHSPNPTLAPTSPTSPTFTEMLAAYQTSVEKPPVPFVLNDTEPSGPFPFSHNYLANTSTTSTPQTVPWLWHQRLPLAGITLLDGDHGCGKTLLAHQIAAAVSSGTPMPDGTPTIQGGVIIVTPFTDPTTTQLQLLTSLGADLSRIEILSFVPNQDTHPPTASFPSSASRPFSLPKDLSHLFAAIERVDARLILFDPFIYLLSSQHRYTNRHLCHLLTDLNQFLLTRNIACLLVRNCRAKGGHAKPSALEQSDHFLTIAASRLLLAPDPMHPMQPDHILLSHALSRHSALTPTLTCQIQPLPANTDLAHFTLQGTHTLQACHLLTHRPDTLHRRLLAQQLLPILANSPSPVAATTLYALFPHSSISQIQHTLKDLLLQGHIQRPTRGFYTSSPTTPKLNPPAATTPQPTTELNPPAATTSSAPPKLNPPAATSQPTTKLNQTAAITSLTTIQLDPTAATTPELDSSAATTSLPTTELNATAATTSLPTTKLNLTAATTLLSNPKPDTTAATTPQPTPKLNPLAATSTKPKPPRLQKHSSKHNKSHGRPPADPANTKRNHDRKCHEISLLLG